MTRRGFQSNLRLFRKMAYLLNITATDTLLFVPFNQIIKQKLDSLKLLLSSFAWNHSADPYRFIADQSIKSV